MQLRLIRHKEVERIGMLGGDLHDGGPGYVPVNPNLDMAQARRVQPKDDGAAGGTMRELDQRRR